MIPMLAKVSVPDATMFVVSAAIVLLGAIGVVLNRNPVRGALCLVATLFGVALLFLEQRADFLAAVQIIVYGGAIVVLFLFVIMLLGVDKSERLGRDPLSWQRFLGIVAGCLVVGAILVLAHIAWATGTKSVSGVASSKTVPNINLLATSLFTTYLLAFEVTSALLVIAVVGAVLLARRRTVVIDLDGPSTGLPRDDDPEHGGGYQDQTNPDPDSRGDLDGDNGDRGDRDDLVQVPEGIFEEHASGGHGS